MAEEMVISHSAFAKRLLAWYNRCKRNLPWRGSGDPYRIWLSEVILQQTRIAQGLPYYERFVRVFPKVENLAAVSEEEVLRHWQGLGYYARARNLHRCAQHVVQKCSGRFPEGYQGLLALPGVGPYTAAAIASMAFGEPVAAVDGNVYRVLSRVFGIEKNVVRSDGKRFFGGLAQRLLDDEEPGAFNEALMEFGALRCLPRNPLCDGCPFNGVCVAQKKGIQDRLPVRLAKKCVRSRFFHYLVFVTGEGIYLKKRLGKDIWRGLYDFYLIERPHSCLFGALGDSLLDRLKKGGKIVRVGGHVVLEQRLTHQRICATFFCVRVVDGLLAMLADFGLFPYSFAEIGERPLPLLVHRFIDRFFQDRFL